MKKICIVGHFAYGKELIGGQTIKTKTIADELERQFGNKEVIKIDTHGGLINLLKYVFQLISAFMHCNNILILPAHNGIKLFVPLCAGLNLLFHRNIIYVVIGGWLPDFVRKHLIIKKNLTAFNGIFVETNFMKERLELSGLTNVKVMPNFKSIKIISKEDIEFEEEPFKVCTFSRVMKEKGIEYAVNAVKDINNQYGREVFRLDIYGPVESEQIEWFDVLSNTFPSYINYKGVVPFNKSTEVLKKYHALLFPTYYEGEGFAGTLLDALASGLPAIATDWKYNKEIVQDNKTGILIECKNLNSLKEALISSMGENWKDMRFNCLCEAKKYIPHEAIRVLIDELR